MIIRFSLSIGECRELEPLLVHNVVSELARAHRNGHHLVILPRTVARWLAANGDFGLSDRATIERLALEYAQTGNLASTSPLHLDIVANHNAPPRRVGNAIVAGVQTLSLPATFDRTVVIVEDRENDGELYKQLFNIARLHENISRTDFIIEHGGGERSINVYNHYVKDERIVILLSDSDRASPVSPNTKLDQLAKNEAILQWSLGKAWVTPCRELENLIPLDVIALLPCAVQRADEINLLKRLQQHEDHGHCSSTNKFLLFFDLKQGIVFEEVKKIHHVETRDWNLAKLALVDSPNEINGFGSAIVRSLLDSGTALSLLRSEAKTAQWWMSFGAFFGDVIWWCVAAQRFST